MVVNQPDIVVMDKVDKKDVVSFLWQSNDSNIRNKKHKKLENYQVLREVGRDVGNEGNTGQAKHLRSLYKHVSSYISTCV